VPESVVNQVMAAVQIVGGSNIVNVNQMGGQVAHSITNIGARARSISPAAAEYLSSSLRACGAETVELRSLSTDAEAAQFAKQLLPVIRDGGWTVAKETWIIPHSPIVGVRVCAVARTDGFTQFISLLQQSGIRANGEVSASLRSPFVSGPITGIIIVAANID
jgi:hypothetical protein